MITASAIADRAAWLDHFHHCPTCPGQEYLADLCADGARLALAVRASMTPAEAATAATRTLTTRKRGPQ